MDQQGKHKDTMGSRLCFAREAAGLSTRDVERQLRSEGKGISHTTIGNYERCVTQPSEEVLKALAAVYQRELEWIRGTGLVLKGVRYRALKSTSVRESNDFKHSAQDWLDTYLYVEKVLDRPLRNKHTNFTINRNISGRRLAEKIRKLYQLGNHALASAIRILEDFGIYVIQIPAHKGIDACAGLIGNSRVVVLNESLSNDRIRLTALHELAHHLYEDCTTGPRLLIEDIESRAFEFASHMLLPEKQLKEALNLKSMIRLVQYKERYGISLAAMIYRARKGNLISESLYKRVWRDFSRLGYRKNEPGHVAADRPLRMESLIDAAVRDKKKMTFAEVAQIAREEEKIVEKRVLGAIGGISFESETRIIDFELYRNRNRKTF